MSTYPLPLTMSSVCLWIIRNVFPILVLRRIFDRWHCSIFVLSSEVIVKDDRDTPLGDLVQNPMRRASEKKQKQTTTDWWSHGWCSIVDKEIFFIIPEKTCPYAVSLPPISYDTRDVLQSFNQDKIFFSSCFADLMFLIWGRFCSFTFVKQIIWGSAECLESVLNVGGDLRRVWESNSDFIAFQIQLLKGSDSFNSPKVPFNRNPPFKIFAVVQVARLRNRILPYELHIRPRFDIWWPSIDRDLPSLDWCPQPIVIRITSR